MLGHGSKIKVNFGTRCIINTLWARYRLVLVQTHSNFICKLWMMGGGTLLNLGHGVKGQGQLWHLVYKTLWARFRLTVFAWSLSNFTCKFFMTRAGTLLISGLGVKFQGQFAPPSEEMSRFALSNYICFTTNRCFQRCLRLGMHPYIRTRFSRCIFNKCITSKSFIFSDSTTGFGRATRSFSN